MPNERHGIQRDLVRSERYDDDNDRRYEIDVTVVSRRARARPTTCSSPMRATSAASASAIPTRTITGAHTYTIDYTVEGALLPFPDHDELYWDAIGHEWNVPIDDASVQVEAPADITDVACFTGPDGSSLACSRGDGFRSDRRRSREPTLAPSAGMTIVVGMPQGRDRSASRRRSSRERRTLEDAFAVNPATLGVSGGLAAARHRRA